MNALARKTVYCPYCASTNGAVKKAGALKIIHDKFRAKKTADEMEKWKKTFNSAIEAQKDLSMYLNRAVHEELNPLKVLDLFKRISDEDCELLGLRPEYARPEEYIWQYISVPPVAIRPSVAQDGASNEDDLTVKLTEIVFTNALIKQGLAKGAPTAQFMVRPILLSSCPVSAHAASRSNGTSSSFPSPCTSTPSFQVYRRRWDRSPSVVSANA